MTVGDRAASPGPGWKGTHMDEARTAGPATEPTGPVNEKPYVSRARKGLPLLNTGPDGFARFDLTGEARALHRN